jgi:hypothetical protein
MVEKNIYQKLANIRVALQESKLKKSGKNGFANFEYFTLDDFLPTLNNLMDKYQVFSNFSINGDVASLTFINSEKPQEQVTFTSPVAEAEIKGSTPIQCLGGVHTYLKRYLYLNAFEIVEGDVLDALVGTEKLVDKKPAPKKNSYTQKDIQETIKNEDAPKQVGKSVDEITNKQLTLEEAQNYVTNRGTRLGDLSVNQLEWIITNIKNSPKMVQAAQIVLDDLMFQDNTDPSGDLPF